MKWRNCRHKDAQPLEPQMVNTGASCCAAEAQLSCWSYLPFTRRRNAYGPCTMICPSFSTNPKLIDSCFNAFLQALQKGKMYMEPWVLPPKKSGSLWIFRINSGHCLGCDNDNKCMNNFHRDPTTNPMVYHGFINIPSEQWKIRLSHPTEHWLVEGWRYSLLKGQYWSSISQLY